MTRVHNPERVGVPSRDFQVVLAGAVTLAILMVSGNQAWFLQLPRFGLSLAFVLYVPGYCLGVSLFARRDSLDVVERLGLSIGLSVALVSVLALLLDWLPWGIHPWTVLPAEYGATAVFVAIAFWRRTRLAPSGSYFPNLAWRPRSWWESLKLFDRCVVVLLAGAMLLGLTSIAWTLAVPSSKSFTTEFYVLGKGGLAEDYPRKVSLGDTLATTVGVTNRERDRRTYSTEIWIVDPWNRLPRTLVAQDRGFSLDPAETREEPVSFAAPVSGEDLQVEFLLFAGDDPQPYRQLRLWMHVEAGSWAH